MGVDLQDVQDALNLCASVQSVVPKMFRGSKRHQHCLGLLPQLINGIKNSLGFFGINVAIHPCLRCNFRQYQVLTLLLRPQCGQQVL